METLRNISSPVAVAISTTAATLVTPVGWDGGTVLLHNPVGGSQVTLTIVADHDSEPENVDATNQLFTLIGGDSLTLSLGAGLLVYGEADATGVSLNVAVGGP